MREPRISEGEENRALRGRRISEDGGRRGVVGLRLALFKGRTTMIRITPQECYEEAINNDPGNAFAWYCLGRKCGGGKILSSAMHFRATEHSSKAHPFQKMTSEEERRREGERTGISSILKMRVLLDSAARDPRKTAPETILREDKASVDVDEKTCYLKCLEMDDNYLPAIIFLIELDKSIKLPPVCGGEQDLSHEDCYERVLRFSECELTARRRRTSFSDKESQLRLAYIS